MNYPGTAKENAFFQDSSKQINPFESAGFPQSYVDMYIVRKGHFGYQPILRTTESIYEFPNIAEVDDVVEVELLIDRAKAGIAHLADGRLL